MTVTSGYAPVNGLELYWESRGEGGTPLVVVHGGFGLASMFGDLLDRLAVNRQVVALELQGHGHTVDIDRPFGWQAFGDDIAATVKHVGLGQVDMMKQSPMYAAYEAVAPDIAAFPALMDKTGALLALDYDWTDEVRALPMPTLLVHADADSHPTTHPAEFYGLIGGGQRDAGWDGAGNQANRLAILPGLSHYDIFTSPLLATVVEQFVS